MAQFFKENLMLKAFGLTKVPLILLSGARIVEISDEKIIVCLPHRKINLNHLNSMYFGALCIGADVAGGFLAFKFLNDLKDSKGTMVFKDFNAQFLKRAEGDTFFECQDGPAIAEAVRKSAATFERIDLPVTVVATVPSKQAEPVAKFVLTLSLKVREK